MDLISTKASTLQTGTTATLNMSIGADYNGLLVVAIMTNSLTLGIGYITSVKAGNHSMSNLSASTGVSVWYLRNPKHSPVGTTLPITVVFSSSYTCGIAGYFFSNPTSAFLGGALVLLGDVTGDPSLSAGGYTVGRYFIDACYCESNNLTPAGDNVSVLNLTSGGNSYASSYLLVDNTTETVGWTRTGTPVNDTWGLSGREIIPSSATLPPRITNS